MAPVNILYHANPFPTHVGVIFLSSAVGIKKDKRQEGRNVVITGAALSQAFKHGTLSITGGWAYARYLRSGMVIMLYALRLATGFLARDESRLWTSF